MYTPGGAVNDCCDTFDIRFPHTVAAPVGVTYFYTERNALAAIRTLCHLLLPPFSLNSAPHNNRTMYKMQVEKQKTLQIVMILYTLNKKTSVIYIKE